MCFSNSNYFRVSSGHRIFDSPLEGDRYSYLLCNLLQVDPADDSDSRHCYCFRNMVVHRESRVPLPDTLSETCLSVHPRPCFSNLARTRHYPFLHTYTCLVLYRELASLAARRHQLYVRVARRCRQHCFIRPPLASAHRACKRPVAWMATSLAVSQFGWVGRYSWRRGGVRRAGRRGCGCGGQATGEGRGEDALLSSSLYRACPLLSLTILLLTLNQIIILPLSVARWSSFSEHGSGHDTVPFGVTAFTAVLFKLCGLIDVVLFRVTRPRVLLFGADRDEGRNVEAGTTRKEGRESSPDLVSLSFAIRSMNEGSEDGIELRTLPSRKSTGLLDDDTKTSLSRLYGVSDATSSLSQLLSPSLMGRKSVSPKAHKTKFIVDPSKPLPPPPPEEHSVLEVDLADELELHAISTSADKDEGEEHDLRRDSVLSAIGQSPVEIAGSPWRNTFLPIEIEIPSSRLGSIYGSWVNLEREERLEGAEPPMPTRTERDRDRGSTSATIGSRSDAARSKSNSRSRGSKGSSRGSSRGSRGSRRRGSRLTSESDDSFQRLLTELGETSPVRNEADPIPPPLVLVRPKSVYDVDVPPLKLRPRANTALSATTSTPAIVAVVAGTGTGTGSDVLSEGTSVDRDTPLAEDQEQMSTTLPSALPVPPVPLMLPAPPSNPTSLTLYKPVLKMQRHPRGPRPPTTRSRSRSSSDPLPGLARHPNGPRQRPTPTVVTNVPRPSLSTRQSQSRSPMSPPLSSSSFRRSPLGPIPEHTVLHDLGPYNLNASEVASGSGSGSRRRTMPASSGRRRKRGTYTSFMDVSLFSPFSFCIEIQLVLIACSRRLFQMD